METLQTENSADSKPETFQLNSLKQKLQFMVHITDRSLPITDFFSSLGSQTGPSRLWHQETADRLRGRRRQGQSNQTQNKHQVLSACCFVLFFALVF